MGSTFFSSSGSTTSTSNAGNASVGTVAQPVPPSADLVGGKDLSGNLQDLLVDASGNLKTLASQGGSWLVTSNIGTTGGLALDATLSAMSVKLPTTLGQKTMANSLAVTLASDQSSILVTISGDTATLSNNIAQWGGTNTSLGQTTMAASVPVTIASNQSALAVSQSGTWNINNISGTISLPTGAATSAKQPALGTAGTPSADVITVQGTAAMTALKVDGSATTQPVSGTVTANAGTGSFTVAQATAANLNATVTGTVTANIGTSGSLALDASVTGLQVAQGSTTSGQKGELELGAVTTAAPSYTTGQTSPLSLTTSGALRTDSSATTQPVSGTVTANAGTGTFTVGQATGTNLHTVVDSGSITVTQTTAANLNATVTGTVSSNQGTPNTVGNSWPVEMTDGTNVLGTSAHPVRTDPTGTTTQPVSGTVTANAGTGTFATADAALELSQGSATSGQKGPLVQGAVTTSAPTYTSTQTSPLSLTTTGALRVDGSTVTQPVSGTVTANIGTTNGLALDSTVSTMSGKLPVSLGQKTMSNSFAVTMASDQTSIPVTIAGDSVTVAVNTSQWGGVSTSLGQKAMASSVPVTLASDQSALAVSQSGTWTVQPGNTANTTPWLATINQGGNSATVTSSGTLLVSGVTAVGAAPAQNPISVSGVDGSGNKQHFKLSTSGNTLVNLNDGSGTSITVGQKAMASSVPVVIASDQTNYPVKIQDGSGNNLTSVAVGSARKLQTDSTSHVSYVTGQGTTFSATAESFSLASGATDNPLLYVKNPNASGKTMYVQEITLGVITANRSATFEMYFNPTSSANGTAVGPINNLAGSATASVGTSFTGPTVSANGTGPLRGFVVGQNATSVIFRFDGAIQIPANNTLLVTGNPSANATVVEASITWTEE